MASTSTVGIPLDAKTCAMPTPIVPAPTTATLDGQASRHRSQRRPQTAPRARRRRPPSARRRGAGAGRARPGRAPRGRPRRSRSRPAVVGAPTSSIRRSSETARSSPPSSSRAAVAHRSGHRVRDEPEHGRRGHRDCEAVRDERRAAVARRLPLVLERRDRIRERVRDVHACAGERDAGDRRRERHRRARLDVAPVGDGGAEVPPDELDRALAERVGERVRALVRRPLGRAGGAGARRRARPCTPRARASARRCRSRP